MGVYHRRHSRRLCGMEAVRRGHAPNARLQTYGGLRRVMGTGSVARLSNAATRVLSGSWTVRLGRGVWVATLGYRACVVVDRWARGVPRRVPPTSLPPRRNCISGRMVVMEVCYGV